MTESNGAAGEFTPAHRGGSGEPLVCLHGFTDTWRTWELILPALERDHDVLAPTLPGHAGGPPLELPIDQDQMLDTVERAMDEAGFESAHLVGNSLGGYVALQLAARGRAKSVVAFAPAGGWALDDESVPNMLAQFAAVYEQIKSVAGQADMIVSTPEGRRLVTQLIAVNYEHIPAELLAHQLVGVARCEVDHLLEYAKDADYTVDPAKLSCPVRIVWGKEDQVLPWPAYEARYRETLADVEWIELDDVGHCPQLDIPEQATRLILDYVS
jgi:pimeloyl-ACP methyl ester carboxylesterase